MNINDFKISELPEFASDEWEILIGKGNPYKVSLQDDVLFIGKDKTGRIEDSKYDLNNGYLLMQNAGEWGGYIKYVDNLGAEHLIKEDASIIGAFKINNQLFFIENTSSKFRVYGEDAFIYSLDIETKEYKIFLILDESVSKFTVVKNNLFLVTSSQLIHYSFVTNYEILSKENLIFNKSLFGLHVNSIVFQNKNIYIGLTGGIGEITKGGEIIFYRKIK